jgi:transposase
MQVEMKIECLDRLLPQNHRARIIWQVVQSLDLAAFYAPIKTVFGHVGRDATSPRLLIGLWLLGNTEGIGSARKLARLCKTCDAYKWLCGGVTVNYHMLSTFRVGHGVALDELFTQVIASLVEKKVIKVHRISNDGTRVRACAGSSSFRREGRLEELLTEAKAHVLELKALLDDPEKSAGLSSRRKAAKARAARERTERLEQALTTVRDLQENRRKDRREPRVSTTDPESRVMKMANGGFNPAVNVQFAVDTESRAIVAVDVTNAGSDAGLGTPLREQVEERTGLTVIEQLQDGGYLKLEEVEKAEKEGPVMYVPPKPARNKAKRGSEYEPCSSDSEELKNWRARMKTEAAQEIYRERASTVEPVNGDVKCHRGLVQMTVKGTVKALCVALWSALAYNLLHFGTVLLG